MKRFALGTAQFGQSYGVANSSGKPTGHEAREILRGAAAAGIDTLDTAISYGDSEAVLGQIGVQQWRVISKVPSLPDDVGDVEEWLRRQVAGSLSRLRTSQLDGLLLHHPADLFGIHGGRYCDALRATKDAGLTKAVGVSIYDPDELRRIWSVWRPDIVQAPMNVFDRRLIHSGWLSQLSSSGVRVHTRSAFLQGLLLMQPGRRPRWFDQWQMLLDRWSRWCEINAVSALQGALGFVLAQPGIERIVIGVDSAPQLAEILDATSASTPVPPDELSSDDRNLLEPSRWRIA